MFGFQGLAVKPLLGHAFPGHDTAPSGAYLILTHHLLQQIFGFLLFLGDDLQLRRQYLAG